MADRDREPKDIETGERMRTLASASADAMKLKRRGEHETEKGAEHRVDPERVRTLIEDWPTPISRASTPTRTIPATAQTSRDGSRFGSASSMISRMSSGGTRLRAALTPMHTRISSQLRQ